MNVEECDDEQQWQCAPASSYDVCTLDRLIGMMSVMRACSDVNINVSSERLVNGKCDAHIRDVVVARHRAASLIAYMRTAIVRARRIAVAFMDRPCRSNGKWHTSPVFTFGDDDNLLCVVVTESQTQCFGERSCCRVHLRFALAEDDAARNVRCYDIVYRVEESFKTRTLVRCMTMRAEFVYQTHPFPNHFSGHI